MENENEDYSVEVSQLGKYRLINFVNMKNIDLYTVRDLQEAFKVGNNEGVEDWIVDLSKILHIDSSGLGGLANQGMYLAKKSKRLFLLSPNSGVKHLFAVTGFNKIFTIVADVSMLP
jgi:anti-anti-sigma factor